MNDINCLLCNKIINNPVHNKKYCSELCKGRVNGKKRPKSGDVSWERIRFDVLYRDSFQCRYCGRRTQNDKSVTLVVDHFLPVSKGGSSDMENLFTACFECNSAKSDKILPIELKPRIIF